MTHFSRNGFAFDRRLGGRRTGDPGVTSPLVLSDRLLALAQAADRAGLPSTADRLVTLAHDVFDEPASLRGNAVLARAGSPVRPISL
ncbi:MAG: hypothetical protein JO264_07410 [Acidisphaera sp.]|nr:hypothetical protein [Acidisphaera sp.]